MTLKELSQLYYLKKEIARDSAKLEELRAMVGCIPSPKTDGMPRSSPRVDSSAAELAADIVDLRAIISAKQSQLLHERARLERYINDIDDSLTRLIFAFRFIDGMDWQSVADSIGGGNTDGSVKMTCYRYLRRHSTN